MLSPRIGRRAHLAALAIWLVPGLPLSFYWRFWIPWLVFMSWYAIIVGHLSGYSAERPVEVADADR